MICTAVSRSHEPIQCESQFPAPIDLYSLTGGEMVSQQLALADGGFGTISPLVLVTNFSGPIYSVAAAASRTSAIGLTEFETSRAFDTTSISSLRELVQTADSTPAVIGDAATNSGQTVSELKTSSAHFTIFDP